MKLANVATVSSGPPSPITSGLEIDLIARHKALGHGVGERGAHQLFAVVLGLARGVDGAVASADRLQNELSRPLLLPRRAVYDRRLRGHSSAST